MLIHMTVSSTFLLQVYQKTHLRKHDMLTFAELTDSPLAGMNLIPYPTWSCSVQSYWSPKTPMKSSGQCMCLPKRQERYHEIYHEMKIDGKWTESGLGCLCFFSLF